MPSKKVNVIVKNWIASLGDVNDNPTFRTIESNSVPIDVVLRIAFVETFTQIIQ